jgi:ribonuclease D
VSHRPSHLYISDRHGLHHLVKRLRHHDRVALDTEFVGEDSFTPRLEIIQIAAEDCLAVVDFPAIGSLDGLDELLADARLEKIVHAGRQDLELFYAHAGRMTVPVFDTQVAAAMVGYGTQIGYAQLVQRITGKKLDKSHTLTNWSQRPLTEEQIAYALEDVQFLLPIHDHLQQRLHALGRLDWVKEEFSRLQLGPQDSARDPRMRYRRIRGWENLKPKAAAVLRELTAWREEEARRRNVPRGRVVRDELLLELARRTPDSLGVLRATRGLHPSEVERNGEAILTVIGRALALPTSEWPEVPRTRKSDPEADGLVDLLQAVLKARALEEKVAPTLLATASDLQALVDAKHHREKLDLPILSGWRRALAGDDLLRVLDGAVTVHVDPRTGKVRLAPKH